MLGDSGEQGRSECPLAGGDVRGDLRALDRRSASALTGRGGGPGKSGGRPACGKACPGRNPPGWAGSRPTRLPLPTHLLRAVSSGFRREPPVLLMATALLFTRTGVSVCLFLVAFHRSFQVERLLL